MQRQQEKTLNSTNQPLSDDEIRALELFCQAVSNYAAIDKEVVLRLLAELRELRQLRADVYLLAHRMRRNVSAHPLVRHMISICEEHGAKLSPLRSESSIDDAP